MSQPLISDKLLTSAPATHFRLEFSERKLLLRIGDIVLIEFGIIGSLFFWVQLSGREFVQHPIREQIVWVMLMGIGWLTWLYVVDMYDLRAAVRIKTVLKRILTGSAIIGLVYLGYFFVNAIPLSLFTTTLAEDGAISGYAPPLRLAPAVALIASTSLLILWRVAYAVVLGAAHRRRRVLILGAGAAGCTLSTALQGHAHFDLVGFIDDNTQKHGQVINDIPVLGGHESLLRLIRQKQVDEIAVAISAEVRGSLFQVIMDCHERGVVVTPMPLLYEQLSGKVAVEHIGSQWYVALPFGVHSFKSLMQITKRLMDIACGLILTAVFLLVLPIVALAIKLDSKGPVFYKQARMGLHGKEYEVIKFRSMVKDAESDGKARWAQKNDARVTRIGKFMRKTRLDELPQVINVLNGEMSMVGPRPERGQFIETLQKQIPFYRTRLATKPGLTGWAQVCYGYGATTEDALIKLQYDLYYIKHQTPLFDLKIMLKTIGVVLNMKGQ